MDNPAYQLVVRELEVLLPPRVVSQLLHEGLVSLGKNPTTASIGELGAILKSQVYPRLQPSLGVTKAKEATQHILAQLHKAHPVADSPSSTAASTAATPAFSLQTQALAIEMLQLGLRPFDLLFEWGETQRLRAQLQLIATEHARGRSALELIAAANVQLGQLGSKLEEELALQAAELSALGAVVAELKADETHSSPTHAPRLRRLETLVGAARRAHEALQRAPAEIERAHALAGELQREAEDERAERAQRLAAETRELTALEHRFAALSALEPETAQQFATCRAQLSAQEPLGDTLSALSAQLASAQKTLQRALQAEFGALHARLSDEAGLAESSEANEAGAALVRDLTLTLKLLETTLPTPAEVQRARDARLTGFTQFGALASWHRLEACATPYRSLGYEAAQAVDHFLRAARGEFELRGALPDLSPGWALWQQLQIEDEAHLRAFRKRLRVAEGATEALNTGVLNTEAATALRRTLRGLHAQQEGREQLSPQLYADLEATLQAAEQQIGRLQGEAATTRAVAAELVGSYVLDDVLGPTAPAQLTLTPLVGTQAPQADARTRLDDVADVADNDESGRGVDKTSRAKPAPPEARAVLAWLEQRRAEAGVSGITLFAPTPAARITPEIGATLEFAVGDLRVDRETLRRAVRLVRRRTDALGRALAQAEATFITLETADCALFVAAARGGYVVVLLTTSPSWGGATRRQLEAALPELEGHLAHFGADS